MPRTDHRTPDLPWPCGCLVFDQLRRSSVLVVVSNALVGMSFRSTPAPSCFQYTSSVEANSIPHVLNQCSEAQRNQLSRIGCTPRSQRLNHMERPPSSAPSTGPEEAPHRPLQPAPEQPRAPALPVEQCDADHLASAIQSIAGTTAAASSPCSGRSSTE